MVLVKTLLIAENLPRVAAPINAVPIFKGSAPPLSLV
jgi:hypothetical protein